MGTELLMLGVAKGKLYTTPDNGTSVCTDMLLDINGSRVISLIVSATSLERVCVQPLGFVNTRSIPNMNIYIASVLLVTPCNCSGTPLANFSILM